MRIFGYVCLLVAFVGSGYAVVGCVAGALRGSPRLLRAGKLAAGATLAFLTLAVGVLAHALVARDFGFQYVVDYSSKLLPWHYSLSALWVGQAGSLLLWAWLMVLLAGLFWLTSRSQSPRLVAPALGLMMGCVCFLVATMIFAADPMQKSAAPVGDGQGLSPLLQHPAMLIHPPVVFLGYAAWAIPFCLAISALLGAAPRASAASLPADWVRIARPWALFAWTVLGTGILLGAHWSYEELGWGGYWGWDPVENGSLIPWMIGTTFIHAMMLWQHLGIFKKTTIALAALVFGMCNFATFLTRSGIFSSLHAFSQSPIGWLFLILMFALGGATTMAIIARRKALAADAGINSIWSREAQIVIASLAIFLMTGVTIAGTLSVALSDALFGRRIVVGPEFYNRVLCPIALIALATLSCAPLLRWGRAPTADQKHALRRAAFIAAIVVGAAAILGVRHPLTLAVAGLAGLATATLIGAIALDVRRLIPLGRWRSLAIVLAAKRRQYAGFVIHLGFVCLAIGVTGSSLGTRRHEVTLKPGEAVDWSGRSIRFEQLVQRELPDKLIAEAELLVSTPRKAPVLLQPAQHFHRLQAEWTTEVAIHSTWSGDFYAILHNGETDEAVSLTLVINPAMRWLWLGGWIMGCGALVSLWPVRGFSRVGRVEPAAPRFLKRQTNVFGDPTNKERLKTGAR